jgi:hypothetical protein
VSNVSPAHRFYLIGQMCIGAAIANAVINGALGWAFVHGMTRVALWHLPGAAADLAGTAFGVTFGTCIVMKFQVPFDERRGRIAPIALAPRVASLVATFPRTTARRAFGLGFLSMPVFALPVILAVAALGAGAMEPGHYVWLKASLAAIQGGLITPFVVLAVLADTKPAPPAPAV